MHTRDTNRQDGKPPASTHARIGILVPTRGRPQMLRALFDSIALTASRPDLIEVSIYCDNDDVATRALVDSEHPPQYPFTIRFFCGPRTATQGEMYNLMWAATPAKPDILMYAGDKIVFASPAWDDQARHAFAAWPDGIGLVCPLDPWHTFHFGAYAFLSRAWVETLGTVFNDWFPFWMIDTWVNQLAWMIDRRRFIPMFVGLQTPGKGATIRLHNFPFWQQLFLQTLPIRGRQAQQLAGAGNSGGTMADNGLNQGTSVTAAILRRMNTLATKHFPYLNERLPEHVMQEHERIYRAAATPMNSAQLAEIARIQANAAAHLAALLPHWCDEHDWATVTTALQTLARGEFWPIDDVATRCVGGFPDLRARCEQAAATTAHASPVDWHEHWRPLIDRLAALGREVVRRDTSQLSIATWHATPGSTVSPTRTRQAWRVAVMARVRLAWCLLKNARFLPSFGHWRDWNEAMTTLVGLLAADLRDIVGRRSRP